MFADLIRKRRSIRKFKQKPVEKEKIDLLIETALRSPSSRGINPWEFMVVTGPELIRKLAASKPHGASFLKNVPLAFVVCGDPQKSDTWIEDTSIASIFLHLAAADLGLGSCWIQIRLRNHSDGKKASDVVKQILGLRDGLEVEAIIAIGYPDEQKTSHPLDSLERVKVSWFN
ncbi:MAG: NAD(P)H-dependent dehydrogenase/reductase [Desulfobacteraceae bacterium]|nr:NAD(P)H-dependent dehydrogenase/reductase [Desulfobacteraceae bacterium]